MPTEAETEAASDAKTKLVLIVEDDPSQLDLTKFVLNREGFRLADVGNGRDALARVEQLSPDLIVLDLMLPGLGGYEFIKEVQAQGCGSVPIIVLTARVLEPKLVETIRFESNVRGFQQKPATAALGRAAHEILKTRRS